MVKSSGNLELIIGLIIFILIGVAVIFGLYELTSFLIAFFIILRTLLIDDLRTFKATQICRTPEEGIRALQKDGPWDLLCLDYDFGKGNKTGYHVVYWLEQHPQFQPRIIRIISDNSLAIKNIEATLQKDYYKFEGDWYRKDIIK